MKKAVKTVGFIAFAMIISKALGLIRDMLLAGHYGTGNVYSAFSNASSLPMLFFDLTLGAAILSTFIPVFNGLMTKDGKQRAYEFSNNFINIMTCVSVILCLIGMLFSRQLAHFIGPDLEEPYKQLTSSLLLILLPTTVFTTLAYSIVGILQSLDEFNIPAIISLVCNAAVIFYIVFLNSYFGVYGLAVAVLIGWSLQFFIQIPSLVKKGYKYKLSFNIKDSGIKEVFILAVPILVSSCIQPASVVINKIFASGLNGGNAVAGLDFSNKFYIMIVGVFAFAITNYIFPSLSRLSVENNMEGFSAIVVQSLRAIIVIIFPVMLGFMLLSKEIVTLFYARGSFDENSVAITSTALFYYSAGMISFGVNEIINKSFFAMKKVKIPMAASVCGIITVLFLSFTFTKKMGLGIGSLALSSTAAAWVISLILLIAINKNTGLLKNKAFWGFIFKATVSALLMAASVYFIKNITASAGLFIQLICCIASGALVYFASLYILRVEELKDFLPKTLRKEKTPL